MTIIPLHFVHYSSYMRTFLMFYLYFISLSDVLQDAKRHLGVLLLLPPSLSQSQQHPSNRLRLTKPPLEVLKKMAQVGISINEKSMYFF